MACISMSTLPTLFPLLHLNVICRPKAWNIELFSTL